MKIVFMGTPEFARRPLEYLYSCKNHEIIAVVTGPDKKSGRGLKLIPTAVKSASQTLGIKVLTPSSLSDESFINEIKEFKADIFVVVAFRILPEKLFTIPKFGSINLHGSLLPKYRGAAPINWALINGETETGLSTFYLKKRVDTGNVIYQKKIAIEPDDNFDSLYKKMSEEAGPAIDLTLELIENDYVKMLMHQDESLATPAPKLLPADSFIDWNNDAEKIVNFIRGMSSIPCARSYFRGKQIKIQKGIVAEIQTENNLHPGQIIKDKHKLLVSTANGVVEIQELQPEGKAKSSGDQFLRGYQPCEKDFFGESQ